MAVFFMKELADYINAHPGELTVGCALGGTSQLIWLNVFGIQGVADKVNYVQCSSEADKLTNVASKAINLGNCSINNALSYQQDGKLKVLGVIGPKGTTKADCETLVGKQLNDSFLTMAAVSSCPRTSMTTGIAPTWPQVSAALSWTSITQNPTSILSQRRSTSAMRW